MCMCYTAQEEISRAVRDIAQGVKDGDLLPTYVPAPFHSRPNFSLGSGVFYPWAP